MRIHLTLSLIHDIQSIADTQFMQEAASGLEQMQAETVKDLFWEGDTPQNIFKGLTSKPASAISYAVSCMIFHKLQLKSISDSKGYSNVRGTCLGKRLY